MAEFELIRQRGSHDCGIACVAMAFGTTYEEAQEIIGRNPNDAVAEFEGQNHAGLIPEEIALAACRRGVPCLFLPVFEISPAGTWQHAWIDVFKILRIDQIAELIFIDKYSAILGVESKNIPGVGHWIYVRDGVVYDPSLRDVYETGEVIPLQCAILFGKNIHQEAPINDVGC